MSRGRASESDTVPGYRKVCRRVRRLLDMCADSLPTWRTCASGALAYTRSSARASARGVFLVPASRSSRHSAGANNRPKRGLHAWQEPVAMSRSANCRDRQCYETSNRDDIYAVDTANADILIGQMNEPWKSATVFQYCRDGRLLFSTGWRVSRICLCRHYGASYRKDGAIIRIVRGSATIFRCNATARGFICGAHTCEPKLCNSRRRHTRVASIRIPGTCGRCWIWGGWVIPNLRHCPYGRWSQYRSARRSPRFEISWRLLSRNACHNPNSPDIRPHLPGCSGFHLHKHGTGYLSN